MKIKVLDDGYVERIEAWGKGKAGKVTRPECDSDSSDNEVGIIEAARQSTQGCFRGWDEDSKLLKHLYKNQHNTPFEFSGMVLEVQAPIMVYREWHRHRTQSFNEMSARYAPLPDLYYVPDYNNLMDRAEAAIKTKNRQASNTGEALHPEAGAMWLDLLKMEYERAEDLYKNGLKMGIPKELARLVMPVGHYSRMRACANLRNWLAFVTLRDSSNAQWEIREYAKAVGAILADTFPKTWALFEEIRNDANRSNRTST